MKAQVVIGCDGMRWVEYPKAFKVLLDMVFVEVDYPFVKNSLRRELKCKDEVYEVVQNLVCSVSLASLIFRVILSPDPHKSNEETNTEDAPPLLGTELALFGVTKIVGRTLEPAGCDRPSDVVAHSLEQQLPHHGNEGIGMASSCCCCCHPGGLSWVRLFGGSRSSRSGTMLALAVVLIRKRSMPRQ